MSYSTIRYRWHNEIMIRCSLSPYVTWMIMQLKCEIKTEALEAIKFKDTTFANTLYPSIMSIPTHKRYTRLVLARWLLMIRNCCGRYQFPATGVVSENPLWLLQWATCGHQEHDQCIIFRALDKPFRVGLLRSETTCFLYGCLVSNGSWGRGGAIGEREDTWLAILLPVQSLLWCHDMVVAPWQCGLPMMRLPFFPLLSLSLSFCRSLSMPCFHFNISYTACHDDDNGAMPCSVLPWMLSVESAAASLGLPVQQAWLRVLITRSPSLVSFCDSSCTLALDTLLKSK